MRVGLSNFNYSLLLSVVFYLIYVFFGLKFVYFIRIPSQMSKLDMRS